MKKERIDLTGQIFGRLKVDRFSHVDEYGKARWVCICECGNISVIRSADLRKGSVLSCGCLQKELTSKRFRKPPGASARFRIYHGYMRHAKMKKFEFELSFENFSHLTSNNCYYCGIKPEKLSSFKDSNGQCIYNGIDRVDNSRGYTLDNCVPCCETCNRAKRILSEKEFLIWINRLYNHQKEILEERLSNYVH